MNNKVKLYKIFRKWGLPVLVAWYMVTNDYDFWVKHTDIEAFE